MKVGDNGGRLGKELVKIILLIITMSYLVSYAVHPDLQLTSVDHLLYLIFELAIPFLNLFATVTFIYSDMSTRGIVIGILLRNHISLASIPFFMVILTPHASLTYNSTNQT